MCAKELLWFRRGFHRWSLYLKWVASKLVLGVSNFHRNECVPSPAGLVLSWTDYISGELAILKQCYLICLPPPSAPMGLANKRCALLAEQTPTPGLQPSRNMSQNKSLFFINSPASGTFTATKTDWGGSHSWSFLSLHNELKTRLQTLIYRKNRSGC